MNLIIVESPTKAKTLSKFLGKDYQVEATFGHIMDLPKSKLSVDIDNDFKPDFQPVAKQEKTIKNLQSKAKKAKTIFLASDPDREGEAIAAHVKELIGNGKTKRIVFHEITRDAVEEAISHPRKVDDNLVDAQTARRVLDRLVGYKISPILWRKVRRGLSAGRVQTVAVRLIVEKEREIEKFKPEEYWYIASRVKSQDTKNKTQTFDVELSKIDGKKAKVSNKDQAVKIVSDLEKASHKISNVIKREVKKSPYPPFTTSTMTQSASRMFGWTAKRTMTVAQKLYEHGFITYHRTDSVNLSQMSLDMSRKYILSNFGQSYLPESPRYYKKQSKNAQEAHEAIRPTNAELDKSKIEDAGQKKLYELIWKRFLASQMNNAIYDSTTIIVTADKYELRASGQVVKFDGWRRVMPLSKVDGEVELPIVEKDQVLDLVKVLSEQKFTQPPARFNEASLIKKLEELGIGRPSTYAPTIQTILLRQYVEKNNNQFFATSVGIAVNDFLLKNFPANFEYQFTAQMEDDLDNVARGEKKWTKIMADFWRPLSKLVKDVEKNAERVKIEVEKTGETCPECGKEHKGELVIRVGRFGKFISCSRFPDCKYTAKYVEKIDMECPKCGEGEVIVKKTGKGRVFFGCSRYPECDWASWKNPQKEVQEGE